MPYVGGRLEPWFSQAPNAPAIREMTRVGAYEASRVAEKNTPVDTGALRQNWDSSKRATRAASYVGVGWESKWWNRLDYAAYVNYGTGLYGPEHRKYLILPKRPGGKLHWKDRATGEDVFASKVLHPGSPGNFMLEISADVLQATWDKVVRPVLLRWARTVERQNPDAVVT